MLTRLKVSGFKNLVDVDVRLGPFTCIAGANATGKSNLFDAIQFLSHLASDTLLNAALSVRSEGGRTADVRNLFLRAGGAHTQEMSFEAEMLIPGAGVDDLGQEARASITFVRYRLRLGYRTDENLPSLGSLELLHEELTHINAGEAHKHLQFPHKLAWRKSVVTGRRVGEFISTGDKDGRRLIKLHQEGTQGRPREYLAANLPRTVLSSVNAAESPTALLVKRELQSWRLLQLEPSALREPDSFTDPPGLGIDGSHIPATLDFLARSARNGDGVSGAMFPPLVLDQLALRLSDLIDNVRAIRLDRDERRQLLTLELMDHGGTSLPARSLSDGTLRFIALAVLDLDPTEVGVICLEEPENGIHPARVEAMLRLLQDIAVDADESIGAHNPLRQIIVNTHSPSVVNLAPDDSLLIAELRETIVRNQTMKVASFHWLPDTWRGEADPDTPPVARGKLLAYLNPTSSVTDEQPWKETRGYRRLIDRLDFQPYLPGIAPAL
ncbi:MAG: AAA family ATPase [Caldilineales bacterium]|nr:AAA family ATPase [Caldilineales bacterium]MCW5856876.1 AAA family ATPase [Caldilineales bacterium]